MHNLGLIEFIPTPLIGRDCTELHSTCDDFLMICMHMTINNEREREREMLNLALSAMAM